MSTEPTKTRRSPLLPNLETLSKWLEIAKKAQWLVPLAFASLLGVAGTCWVHPAPQPTDRTIKPGVVDSKGFVETPTKTHRKVVSVTGKLPDGVHELESSTRIEITGRTAAGTIEAGLAQAIQIMKRVLKEMSE